MCFGFVDMMFCFDLVVKYGVNGLCYMLYFIVLLFCDDFDLVDYGCVVCDFGVLLSDLLLYFYILFCNIVCFYCGCNKIVINNCCCVCLYFD